MNDFIKEKIEVVHRYKFELDISEFVYTYKVPTNQADSVLNFLVYYLSEHAYSGVNTNVSSLFPQVIVESPHEKLIEDCKNEYNKTLTVILDNLLTSQFVLDCEQMPKKELAQRVKKDLETIAEKNKLAQELEEKPVQSKQKKI